MASPNAITDIDITNPQHLLAMQYEIEPAPSFIRDTYFPTNPATDVFSTVKVIIDYQDGNRRIAPFITKGSLDDPRPGFYSDELEPARIAPSRNLTVDQLNKRGYGEAVFSRVSPADRAAIHTMNDMTDLTNQIIRTIEVMGANCMLDNGYTCRYFDSKGNFIEDVNLTFNDTESAPPVYTPGTPWDSSEAKIFGDLQAMVLMLKRNFCPAKDLIVGTGIGNLIMSNPIIQKHLDNRRYELGKFDPVLDGTGAAVLGILNVAGNLIRIIEYGEEYEKPIYGDDNKPTGKTVLTPFIPSDRVVMTAPNAGRTLFGAVTQIDEGGGPHKTYAEPFVPKFRSDEDEDERRLRIVSKPLPVPNRKGCFVSASIFSEPSTPPTEGGDTE